MSNEANNDHATEFEMSQLFAWKYL